MSATTKTLARKVNTADKRDAAPVEKRMIDIGTMMERILAAAQTRESELAEQVAELKRKLAATEMELAELRVRLGRC